MTDKIYVIGGGTFSHVRNHLALGTPAFGTTAIIIDKALKEELRHKPLDIESELILTKMANRESELITNEDVRSRVDFLVEDPSTKAIIFNCALTDFTGIIDDVPSGKYADRLQTKNGNVSMIMTPATKVIGGIRQKRPDIIVVGFKTTTNQTVETQHSRAMNLMQQNMLSYVVANDTVTRHNILIDHTGTVLFETPNRDILATTLASIIVTNYSRNVERRTYE